MRGRKGPHRSQGHEAAMETFMNLGADEIDIRSIKGDFVVHNEKDDIWNKVSPSPVLRGWRWSRSASYIGMASSAWVRERADERACNNCARAWLLPGTARLQRHPDVYQRRQLHRSHPSRRNGGVHG